MGRSRRDTRVYELKDGRQIVYFGITNNPDRRLSEHVKSDKEFTHMNLVSPKLSRKSAESMEAKKIRGYDNGRGPKFNTRKTR